MQTIKELRERAGELNIKGRWTLNKGELIAKIAEAEAQGGDVAQIECATTIENEVVDTGDNWDELPEEPTRKKQDKVVKVFYVNGEKKEVLTVKPEVKNNFIQEAPIGALVAFELDGRVRSAKIVNRSTKRQLLKLENRRGREVVVPYESVLWVRKGGSWPKAIFEMLTGGVGNGENGSPRQSQ